MFAALSKLAGAVIGGVISRRNAKDARKFNERQTDPAYIRQRYEAAGFHPLLGLGDPVASAVTSNFGFIVARGFGDFGRAVQEDQALKLQATALEQENERLRQRNERMMLHPETGGIYHGSAKVRPRDVSQSRSDMGRDEPDGVSVRADGVEVTPPKRLETPAFKMFGRHYYASGNFSSAETFEDSVGELGSAIMGIPIFFDTVGHTARHYGGGNSRARVQRRQDAARARANSARHTNRAASSQKSNAIGSRGRVDRRDRSRPNLYR